MKPYPIENKIHASIISYCEELQNKGVCVINGVQLAKTLTSLVAIGMLSEQQKKIYNCLTEKPKDTKTISQEIKISNVTVCNQLKKIHRMTQLVSFKREGRVKLWFK